MSLENNSKKQWTDPKDYGLPVVEIKPIHSISSSKPILEEPKPEVISPAIEKEIVPNPIVQSIIAEKSEEVETSKKTKPSPASKPVPQKEIPVKKESKSWIGIVAVLALVLVSVIIWQMTTSNQVSEESIPPVAEEAQVDPILEEENSNVNESKEEETQVTENQITEVETASSETTPIQKPETGTTIDRTVAGTLIRVESKAERPTYYIIVGSLPSERLALEEAPVYQNRVPSVYLISPYDDNTNYRLAIGSFGSFTKANEELERIKADYTEALWILKY